MVVPGEYHCIISSTIHAVANTLIPRACLGQQFALTSSAYTLVRICQNFERIEDNNGDEAPRMTIGLVNMKLDGVKVRFHRSRS